MPGEHRWLRLFLLLCGLAALIVGTLAALIAPPRTDVVATWMQTTILPAAILLLLVVNRGDRLGLLALTCGLLYVEAVLTASLYTIGIAFAILLPIMGIGLVQPQVRGLRALAVYIGAGVASTFAVALQALSVPVNPLNEPGLAVVGFALLAAFALGLMWHAGERLREALDAAEREVAARAEAETALGQTVQILDTLIRSSPVATVAVDAEGIVSVWSPAAERVFGWSEAETVGRAIPEPLAAGGEIGGLADRIARTLGGDVIQGERVSVRRRDGSELLVEVYAAPRYNGQARPLGTIAQMTDVTERTALEAQLRQAQKMEAVGLLAGGIAHDVNNTLTAVGGFAELIEGASSDPEIRRDALTITAAVGRARQLTRQLLAFARRSVLQPETVDVTAFVSSIRPMLQRLLGSDVDVVIRSEIDAGRIRVDAGQLEQAILNLAVNARDAMPGGGVLTISTRREPASADDDAAPRIVLAVSDSGGGIPAEVQDQVFEPFFTTKERGKGTGLGLAMVYGFVTQSGGEVELHSTPGSGTTIEVRLPEARDEETPASVATGPTSDGGSECILLVEDEQDVAEFTRQVLRTLGYEVLVADGPSVALEIAADRRAPIDLVLTDVIMPGLLGPEVAARIAATHPEATVLYASGFTADAIADRGILPEGVELIEKPYTSAELAARVRSVLDARTG